MNHKIGLFSILIANKIVMIENNEAAPLPEFFFGATSFSIIMNKNL